MTAEAVFGQAAPQVEGCDYNTMVFLIQQGLLEVQTMTLVKVIKCTNSGGVSPSGTVDVQPLVNQMTGNRLAIPHGVLYKMPYQRVTGGNSAIIIDPVPGDIGLAIFASRDISGVKSSKAQANPGSFRTFNYADGIYIPGVLNGTPTQYLQMLAAAAGINLVTPGTLTIDAAGADIVAPTNITGDTEVTGDTTLTGDLLVTGVSTLQSVTATDLVAPAAAITALEVTSITPIGGGSFPAPVFPVAVRYSISGNGLLTAPLQLLNDVSLPGANMVYGTNAGGIKGWYAASGGGGGGTVTSVGFSSLSGTITISGVNPITGAGVADFDLSAAAQTSLALANSALQSILSGAEITVTGGNTPNLSTAAQALLVLAGTALQPNAVSTTVTYADLTIVDGLITAASSGTAPSALALTDGTSTVTPTTQITASGLTVGGSTPNATLTYSFTDASTAAIYTVSHTLGAWAITLKTQSANTFLRGPTSGAAAQPTFGPLNIADGIVGIGSQMTTLTQAGGASQVWTIPTTANWVAVVLDAGGGGGGSGQHTASGAAQGGGGGGGGGGKSYAIFRAADLIAQFGATVTITFSNAATGGNGGPAITATASGQNGIAGSDISFGGLLIAHGGFPGTGGVGGNGTGGTAGTGNIAQGTIGGNATASIGQNGGVQSNGPFAATGYGNTGGGGGAGLAASTPAATAGGNGGSSSGTLPTMTLVGGPGGTAGNPGTPGPSSSAMQPSGGGGGGSSNIGTNNGQPGGHGGDFGAGGGGGGASLSTSTQSGAGGRGGLAAANILAW